MLTDRLTGKQREVDVCVHALISGKGVTLVLECCDPKRKGDQTWVDMLRGKYVNLPIDKVIAVARSGFAKTAQAVSGEGGNPDAHTRRGHGSELAPDCGATGGISGRGVLAGGGQHRAASREGTGACDRDDDGAVCLGICDRMMSLADVLERDCTSAPVAQLRSTTITSSGWP
jgi:hypothetical protein